MPNSEKESTSIREWSSKILKASDRQIWHERIKRRKISFIRLQRFRRREKKGRWQMIFAGKRSYRKKIIKKNKENSFARNNS